MCRSLARCAPRDDCDGCRQTEGAALPVGHRHIPTGHADGSSIRHVKLGVHAVVVGSDADRVELVLAARKLHLPCAIQPGAEQVQRLILAALYQGGRFHAVQHRLDVQSGYRVPRFRHRFGTKIEARDTGH